MLTPFSQTGVITSWSFFNNNPGITLPVTPFIATRTGASTFDITAIGTTRFNSGTGVQTFAFEAISGTPNVDNNTFFGFHSGAINSGTTGVIELDTSVATSEQFLLRLSSSSLSLGSASNFNPYGDRRIYSVQAVSTGVVVPEAGTYALLAAGLLPLAALIARRRRAA